MHRFVDGVRYALAGLTLAWKEEANFRIEIVLAALVLVLGFLFRITLSELVSICIVIGLVFAAELLNTALEELCDKFQPTHDPHIKKIKDLAAAAVFVASLAAFGVGCIIFIPHFL
jgi:undecaprenol kinase/diacylglycerol kinase (ATP)